MERIAYITKGWAFAFQQSVGGAIVNGRKTNRKWLTMLSALVAISVVGNVVGLIVHYALHPVVSVPTEAAASPDVMSRSD